MLPDRVVRILQYCNKISSTGGNRAVLMQYLGDQNCHIIWIDSAYDYMHIGQQLTDISTRTIGKKHHIVIYQTEEDWFSKCDFQQVRNTIKNHPAWSDQSYIVTNSRQDKKETLAMGISAVCRPGLLDLITYLPYDYSKVTINNITHHTGICGTRLGDDRMAVWELLTQYQDRVTVAKFGTNWTHSPEFNNYVINNLSTSIIETDSIVTAPYQDIETDLWWAKNIAFGTVVETRHQGSPGELIAGQYTTTTSEKTYRNMHLLRPAVICGGLNTRQYLLDLGFDTWDWFVDWSFDSESDDSIRFVKFLKELERLMKTPLSQLTALINQHQDNLLHNRDRLFWLINNYATIDL
jgi:hypothetical protein